MSLKFTDKDWAITRIGGTFVLDKKLGHLVKVTGFVDRDKVEVLLKSGEPKMTPWDDLDITPISLGCCSSGFDAYHLYRVPKRRDYKQGYRSSNTSIRNLSYFGTPKRNIEDLFYEFPVKEYPEIGLASEMVQDQFRSVALSKDFAIDQDMNIIYKNFGVIGDYDHKRDRVKLTKRFEYLAERAQTGIKGVNHA